MLNLCYKYNTSKNKNQDSNIKIYNPIPNRVVKENPQGYISGLSNFTRATLNILINLQHKHGIIFASQERIASMIGSCTKTVTRAVRDLARVGLIRKEYRHMKTCLYRVTSFLFKQEIRDSLMGMLPALKYFLFANLLISLKPSNSQYLKKNVPLINIKEFNYIKSEYGDKNINNYIDISYQEKVRKPENMVEKISTEKNITSSPSIFKKNEISNTMKKDNGHDHPYKPWISPKKQEIDPKQVSVKKEDFINSPAAKWYISMFGMEQFRKTYNFWD